MRGPVRSRANHCPASRRISMKSAPPSHSWGMKMSKGWVLTLAALVWGLLLAIVLAPAAGANWGAGCGPGDTEHCYAETTWSMSGNGKGGGEEVMGLSSEIDTVSMLVPYWEEGNFVTNEQWMGNP